jgi:DNA-binding MarR family transcriptional regulator
VAVHSEGSGADPVAGAVPAAAPDAGHGPRGDDLADEFLELYYGLMRDMRREAAAVPGLTTPGQVRLLRALRRAGEPRRPGELALDLDVAARSITAKVDQAEEEGLVRRLPDPSDRRATLVELTDAGLAVLDAVASARHEGAAARLDRLTADEQAQLLALLRRVRELPPRE